MSFFDKVKAGAASAADAAKRGGEKLGLQSEIRNHKALILQIKQKFGETIYAAWSDEAEKARIFNETKAQVDNLEKQIAEKEAKCAALDKPSAPAASQSASAASGTPAAASHQSEPAAGAGAGVSNAGME